MPGAEKLFKYFEKQRKEVKTSVEKALEYVPIPLARYFPLQDKYCKDNMVLNWIPIGGFCYSCGKPVEDSGERHITGCRFCNRSFVE